MWVVDVPGHYETKTETKQVWVDEVGHWEEDWYTVPVYYCNDCGATYPTSDEVNAHIIENFDSPSHVKCGYTVISSDPIYTGEKAWVVDEPGHYETKTETKQVWVDEVGHWEYK